MENGYVSTRQIEKLCKTDIRFMWLLQDEKAPSHMTIANFMNNVLCDSIENILSEINAYIFEKDYMDLEDVYIDGTKLNANANKYSWVWKKSSIKNRDNTFQKISTLLEEVNGSLALQGIRLRIRKEYAIEYMEQITEEYLKLTGI